MNDYRDANNPYCYFHPKEVVAGVCPLCLNERLLILAAKQRHHHHHTSSAKPTTQTTSQEGNHHGIHQHHKSSPYSITLPKFFAFGSLLHRLEFRQSKSDYADHDLDTSTSQEDSFISMKFEDNGAASWENKKNNINVSDVSKSKVSLDHCNMSMPNWTSNTNTNTNKVMNNCSSNNKSKEMMSKSVVEHAKPHAPLRWRKRIGQLLQLVRWKRSNKGTSVCHVGSNSKVEGVKVRNKGWIRSTLTRRRRTKE